jgi:hypothetical protein
LLKALSQIVFFLKLISDGISERDFGVTYCGLVGLPQKTKATRMGGELISGADLE